MEYISCNVKRKDYIYIYLKFDEMLMKRSLGGYGGRRGNSEDDEMPKKRRYQRLDANEEMLMMRRY